MNPYLIVLLVHSSYRHTVQGARGKVKKKSSFLQLVEHLNVKVQDVKSRYVEGPSNMICGFKTRFGLISEHILRRLIDVKLMNSHKNEKYKS